ncbi:hypothetical protein FHS76_000800 [Ochrobactrum daejeonense]|uniref:Uncharacterized protein n=1 Tax=Brucella daejeonensis TaxID=659015 RepID=A0A7W9AV20_9HYPH|nr:hypothetical protein [Brucella daejeonensis]
MQMYQVDAFTDRLFRETRLRFSFSTNGCRMP